jgi:predicted nucleic acid-binding protein
MLVVDASVAVKWFVEEPGTVDAMDLLKGSELVIAPELVIAEVANVVWRLSVRGALKHDQVAHVPGALPRMFAELWPLTWLAPRALEIAAQLHHPVYDCFYLALAEGEGATMVTAAWRLIGRLAGSPWQQRCRPLVG